MSKAGDIAGGIIGIILAIIFVYLIIYAVKESFRRSVKDKWPKVGTISDVMSWPFRKIKDAFSRNRYNRLGGYGGYGSGYSYKSELRPYSLYSPGYSSW